MPQCKGTHGKQRNAKENEPKRNGKWQKVWRKLIANKGKTKKKEDCLVYHSRVAL